MTESAAPRRDYLNATVTLVTVIVGVWSLYYSGVQAEVARKTLSLTCNESQARLQADLAGIQKQLAAGTSHLKQADLLGRIADLQLKLAAEQKRFANERTDEELAQVQQALGEVQQALAKLQQDQEQKDRELASLRTQVAEAKKPPVATVSALTPPVSRLLTRSPESLFAAHPPRVPLQYQVPLTTSEPDDSWLAWAKAKLLELWSLCCQHPVPSIYFALALGWAVSRLVGAG
ncbi:MAG: hypothetical protein JNM56_15490 [Planctomycetia bacterium]|nr:hypothetical protein [Planctomycetia bacterium]